MAGIPDSVIDDVRSRADLVTVLEAYGIPLKKRGSDYWACCPFHQEKTPSFKASLQHQTYYCFGCKKSGNVFHFVQEKENVDFVGAVRLLAQRYNVIIPEEETRSGVAPKSRDRLYELLTATAHWYQQQLRENPDAEKARAYLLKRGIPDDVLSAFGLGYAPDSWDAMMSWGVRQGFPKELQLEAGMSVPREEGGGAYDRFRGRLVFPIWDELGRVVGFSARTLDPDAGGAKYINTPETPVFHKGRLLYALHLARQSFKNLGFALICEGQFDVIACHRAGMTNAVAPQGTAFTETHAQLLKRFTDRVTFAFDADTAGVKAALRSLEIAIVAGFQVKVVILPTGEDPDSLFKTQGATALATVLNGGKDALVFALEHSRLSHDVATPQGKAEISAAVLPAIALYPNPVTRAGHCQWLARELGLPESSVFEALNQLVRQQKRTASPAPGERQPAPAVTAGPQVIDRIELMLLDLALHFERYARLIETKIPHERLRDLPVGRALNLVLGMAAQGEWAQAVAELTRNQDIAANPEIARILVHSDFPHEPAEDVDSLIKERFEQRLTKAMNDCLSRLELEQLEQDLNSLGERSRTTTESHEKDSITLRYQELLTRKNQLKQALQRNLPPPDPNPRPDTAT